MQYGTALSETFFCTCSLQKQRTLEYIIITESFDDNFLIDRFIKRVWQTLSHVLGFFKRVKHKSFLTRIWS